MTREYGRVNTRFWNSPDIRSLSNEGKLLAAYLITGPHSNMIGAYLLPDAYVAVDLGWSLETVSKGFAELFRNGFATRFRDARHICICKFLVWNPIENPNVGKAALKTLDQLPDDPALQHVIKGLELYEKQFPNGLERVRERFRKGFETVGERFRNIEPEPEPEPEQEPEPEPTPPPLRGEVIAPATSLKLSRHEVDAQFDQWWEHWPKKVSKLGARREFENTLRKRLATLPELIAGAERHARCCEAKYQKDPARWLRDGCWTDEERCNRHRVGAASAGAGVLSMFRKDEP